MSYLLIFISKSIENILTTLKIIFISNHKKLLGSILNFFITLIWILSAIFILRNLNRNPIYIFIYAFGCFIGTYLGCIIEEKLALGDNMLTIITSNPNVYNKLLDNGYMVTRIDDYNYSNYILLLVIKRSKKNKVYSIIKLIDNKSTIISETINIKK